MIELNAKLKNLKNFKLNYKKKKINLWKLRGPAVKESKDIVREFKEFKEYQIKVKEM